MRFRIQFAATVVSALLLAASFVSPAFPQNPNLSKRLILKDGSYQPATKWEIKGDRVRYYSAERFEWEEIPKDLIDWPATDKWNKERQAGSVTSATKTLSAEIESERQKEEAQSPTVAPGVRLPSNGGVFLLDHYHAQPQLAELVQSGGEINKQMGRNILRATINPIASQKQSIELAGTKAQVQAHQLRPVIFLDVEADKDPTTGVQAVEAVASHRFRLIRLQVKKDARVVGNLRIAITGHTSQQESFIDAKLEPYSGEWIKVTPVADLQPGEYALVEMLSEKEINLYVWDFGVNPSAPANPTAWKPTQPVATQTGTNDSPVLNKKRPQ